LLVENINEFLHNEKNKGKFIIRPSSSQIGKFVASIAGLSEGDKSDYYIEIESRGYKIYRVGDPNADQNSAYFRNYGELVQTMSWIAARKSAPEASASTESSVKTFTEQLKRYEHFFAPIPSSSSIYRNDIGGEKIYDFLKDKENKGKFAIRISNSQVGKFVASIAGLPFPNIVKINYYIEPTSTGYKVSDPDNEGSSVNVGNYNELVKMMSLVATKIAAKTSNLELLASPSIKLDTLLEVQSEMDHSAAAQQQQRPRAMIPAFNSGVGMPANPTQP